MNPKNDPHGTDALSDEQPIMPTNEQSEQPKYIHMPAGNNHYPGDDFTKAPTPAPGEPTATPRTDAATFPVGICPVVDRDFARTLEQELTDSRAEVERLTKGNDALVRQLGIMALEREATEPKAPWPTETPITDMAEYEAYIENGPASRVVSGRVARALERKVNGLRSERDNAQGKLHEIDCATEGSVDGSPDRSSLSALCNQLQTIIHPPQ